MNNGHRLTDLCWVPDRLDTRIRNLDRQPLFTCTASDSLMLLQDLVEGRAETFMPRIVDVRDVARAHVLAAELPHAKGRYLVTQAEPHELGEHYEVLSKRFPEYSYPSLPHQSSSKPAFDNSKVICCPMCDSMLHDLEASGWYRLAPRHVHRKNTRLQSLSR